jgi:hypothetical protein
MSDQGYKNLAFDTFSARAIAGPTYRQLSRIDTKLAASHALEFHLPASLHTANARSPPCLTTFIHRNSFVSPSLSGPESHPSPRARKNQNHINTTSTPHQLHDSLGSVRDESLDQPTLHGQHNRGNPSPSSNAGTPPNGPNRPLSNAPPQKQRSGNRQHVILREAQPLLCHLLREGETPLPRRHESTGRGGARLLRARRQPPPRRSHVPPELSY